MYLTVTKVKIRSTSLTCQNPKPLKAVNSDHCHNYDELLKSLPENIHTKIAKMSREVYTTPSNVIPWITWTFQSRAELTIL